MGGVDDDASRAAPRPAAGPGRRAGWAARAAIVVGPVAVVPMAYVILGGFRTTGQLAADPAGLPDPWVPANYTESSDPARSGGRSATAS